ncbi:MAG: YopT-type cysteine protease domain-containing protein [Chlamydiales bacterium]
MFGQFLGRILYALGLLIASVAYRIFSRDIACTYFSMASTQFNRGSNALVTYCQFGEKLIDFSYNGCVIAPSSDTEQNALRARYGSNAIDQWLRIGTKEIPLKPEKLKRVETGICLGMTLDFLKQYLQQMQAGVSPMEAIREISSRYVTGAPDQAQLAQIFYSALDSTHVIEKEWAHLDASMEGQRTDTLRWFDQQREQIRALSREQILERLTQVQTQCNERLNNFRVDALSKKIVAIARIETQRDEIASNQFGLQMGSARIYAHEEISAEYDVEFSQFLEELPNGCYAGGFRAKGCAHAVTLIKSSDSQYFLFDPNFGTLVFKKNEIAEKLWNIGKSFYLKNGLCSLSFSSCRLQ